MSLPDFPVDDTTLDMLTLALDPGPEATQTSLYDFLALMSQLGGSDLGAVTEEVEEIAIMRDQQYTAHDVIRALVAEVRAVRSALRSDDTAVAVARTHYLWSVKDNENWVRWEKISPLLRQVHVELARNLVSTINEEVRAAHEAPDHD